MKKYIVYLFLLSNLFVFNLAISNENFVIDFSKFTLLALVILIIYSLYHAKNFNLDASSDALLLEGDKDLNYLREINERYGSKDYLFLTYSPITDFTDEETIVNLQFLKSKIETLYIHYLIQRDNVINKLGYLSK